MKKKEIVLLEKKFYKHMADIFLEMAKSLLISKKDMIHRFKFNNITDIADSLRDIVLVGYYPIPNPNLDIEVIWYDISFYL